MATTKKAAETAAVDYSTMNVFQKLQLARVRFLEAGVDKSGKHMKLEYKYFELADIVPKAEQIFLEIGLMMVPSMYGDKATARVYNVNDREDFIDFVAPVSYTHLDVYKRQRYGSHEAALQWIGHFGLWSYTEGR